MTIPTTEGENEIMLKTIRLSKNIFSLTERLPKAKYRSPKVFGGSGVESNSLLPTLTNEKRAKNMSTVQPPDDTKPIIKSVKQNKGKSRLQEYLDQ